MALEEKEACVPIVRPCLHEIPLDELEERLEMQQIPHIESAVACYTDFCPSDCTLHCSSGYAGCTDLCACDGTMCAAECSSLCVADSCVIDIL